jgi:alkaline phosphatase D
MIWGGMNIYLRESDWDSKTRFTTEIHSRSIMRHNHYWQKIKFFAVWDDHDYGPDNSDRSFTINKSTQKHLRTFLGPIKVTV